MYSLEKFNRIRKKIKGKWKVNPATMEAHNPAETMCVKIAAELASDSAVLEADPELIKTTVRPLAIYYNEPPEVSLLISGELLKAAMEAVEKTDDVRLEYSECNALRLRIKTSLGTTYSIKNAPETIVWIAPKIED